MHFRNYVWRICNKALHMHTACHVPNEIAKQHTMQAPEQDMSLSVKPSLSVCIVVQVLPNAALSYYAYEAFKRALDARD